MCERNFYGMYERNNPPIDFELDGTKVKEGLEYIFGKI